MHMPAQCSVTEEGMGHGRQVCGRQQARHVCVQQQRQKHAGEEAGEERIRRGSGEAGREGRWQAGRQAQV